MAARVVAHRTTWLLIAACGGSPAGSEDDLGITTTAPTSVTAITVNAPSTGADASSSTTDSLFPETDSLSGTAETGGETGTSGEVEPEGELEIWWIDTEGGAATLFVTPGGPLVLVDAGFPGDRDADRIAAVVQGELGRDTIDLCIVTHFHTDHAGGIPELAERVAITNFWDHGDSVEAGGEPGQSLWQDYLATADGKRTVVAPGEVHDIGGLRLELVSAHGQLIQEPLANGGADNPACDGAQTMPPDGGENPMSVGFVARFGDFDMLDLGDLTWSYEHELACRTNLLGPIDLYQTTHHGQSNSGATQLVHAVDPVVVVMNNGPHKGGAWETFERIGSAPSLPDLWQVHRALDNDDAHNTVAELVANEGENENDEGHWLHARVDATGLVTLTNGRNLHSRDYQSL